MSQQGRRPDPPFDIAEQSRATSKALGALAAGIMPWLFDIGDWVFGGLIAVNLVLISALITVGPVDTAILVAITAFGCALPLDVAGISLLRLVKDVKDVGIDDLTPQSFKEAGFPDIDAYIQSGAERESQRKRRATVAVGYAAAMASLSIALIVAGLVAALWYMGWWVGVVALSVALVSAVLVALVFVHGQPPDSEAEKQLKRRYADFRAHQRRGRR